MPKRDYSTIERKERSAPVWVRGGVQLPLAFDLFYGDPDTSGGTRWAINTDRLFDPETGLVPLSAVEGAAGTGIPSIPDGGGKTITNIYVTADGKLKVEFDDGL